MVRSSLSFKFGVRYERNAAHYSQSFVHIGYRTRELCAVFERYKNNYLSQPQGKLVEVITQKLVCTWSNRHSENLLWFKRNRTNDHGIIALMIMKL